MKTFKVITETGVQFDVQGDMIESNDNFIFISKGKFKEVVAYISIRSNIYEAME